MEVMLKGSTKISGSPKRFAVSSLEFENDTAAIINPHDQKILLIELLSVCES